MLVSGDQVYQDYLCGEFCEGYCSEFVRTDIDSFCRSVSCAVARVGEEISQGGVCWDSCVMIERGMGMHVCT